MATYPPENRGAPSFAGNDRRHVPLLPVSWLGAAISVSGLIVLGLMVRNQLTVDADNWGFKTLLAGAAGLISVHLANRRAQTRTQRVLRDLAESGFALLAICALGAIASYAAASDTSGFYDDRLHAADRLMRFDWLALYRLVAERPWLQRIGEWSYASVFVSPLLILVSHAWHHDQAYARRFLLTFWIGVVLTLALFPLFPARGALAFLWHGPVPYMPTNGLYQGAIIPALRDHAMRTIDLTALRGLVCAPSFHTVCGVLFIAEAWPLKRLRWVLVPLNLAMLLSTPIEGTHYLSDMVLGALVALAALVLARLVLIQGGANAMRTADQTA